MTDKLFFDEKTGILHGTECPRTKKEFGEGTDGECKLEKFLEHLDVQGTDAPCHGGPAQVATKAYRDGYDRIFGTKPTVGQA